MLLLNVTRNLETKHKIHLLQHNHSHLYTPQSKTTHAAASPTPTHPCTPAYTQTHLHTLYKTKENLKLLFLQKVLQKEEEKSRLKHLR